MCRATEGKIISEILTREDKNVFQGCTHTEFADALRGKKVANVGRLGKYFYVGAVGSCFVLLLSFDAVFLLARWSCKPLRM
jgi:formamidopyrimidine-DNA glycosylase